MEPPKFLMYVPYFKAAHFSVKYLASLLTLWCFIFKVNNLYKSKGSQ